MKKLLTIITTFFIISNAFSFDKASVMKAKLLKECVSCDLTGADFIKLDFKKIKLSLSNLSGADLRNANLTGADLRFTNLTNVNISGAKFKNADLFKADLTNAEMAGASLKQAILCRTILPWGEEKRDCKTRSVDGSMLEKKDDRLWYEKGDIEPFTGKRVFYHKGNKSSETQYKNGKRHGKSISYHKGNKSSKTQYKDGKKHGKEIYYDEDGITKFNEKQYKDGKKVKYLSFFGGKGKYGNYDETIYENDKKTKNILWNRISKKKREDFYNDDEQVVRTIWYHKDGVTKESDTHKKPTGKHTMVKHGKRTTYHSNGNKHEVINYKNDKAYGRATGYNENGDKIVVVNFKDGKKHGKQVKYKDNKRIGVSCWDTGKKTSCD